MNCDLVVFPCDFYLPPLVAAPYYPSACSWPVYPMAGALCARWRTMLVSRGAATAAPGVLHGAKREKWNGNLFCHPSLRVLKRGRKSRLMRCQI